MNKLILALCLILLPTSLWAGGVMIMGGGTPAAAAGCTTANDSIQWTALAHNESGAMTEVFGCTKFTLAATTTITEYVTVICDQVTADVGSVRVSIYSHHASDYPDAMVTGTDVSIASTSIPNCGTRANHTFTLGTPKTGMAAGTYWLCVEEVGGANRDIGYGAADATHRVTYGSSPQFNPTASYSFAFDVYGCLE